MSSDRRPHPTARAFVCPLCDAYAAMKWRKTLYSGGAQKTNISTATCDACDDSSVWLARPKLVDITGDPDHMWVMISPNGYGGVPAADDMPPSVAAIYDEARSVVRTSPRSASALLRLALEGLLNDLYPGAKLNEAIGLAAKSGLPRRVIDSMDVLRFSGNASIHELSREDTAETASSLFKLLNIVVRLLITEPREIAELHDDLPATVRDGIDKRDKPVTSEAPPA